MIMQITSRTILLQIFVGILSMCSCNAQERIGDAASSVKTQGQIVIDKSGQTFVNNHRIVIGLDGEAATYKQMGTIFLGKSKQKAPLLECSAVLIGRLNNDEVDTVANVSNVTFINRDTIEIHSKGLVEKYAHLVRDAQHPDHPYQNMRMLAMSSEGEGNMMVNEGVIDIYLDHDPTTGINVYGIGMIGKHCNTFINRGKIRFHGMGSPKSRVRGMASMSDNVMFVNDGSIIIDVKMTDDARMITSGGDYNDIINNGTMEGRSSGTMIGMTRYGDSHITNNGAIALTVETMPTGYQSTLSSTDKFACGLFEFLNAKRKHIAPVNNKGGIVINLNDNTDDQWKAYGLCVNMLIPCEADFTVNNVGTITLTNRNTANNYSMAEVGTINRTANKANIRINVGKWHTSLRDFTGKNGLFHGSHVTMDFSKAEFVFEKQPGYTYGKQLSVSPETLLYCADGETPTNQYIGYDNMKIVGKDGNIQVDWDKNSKKVSLKKGN